MSSKPSQAKQRVKIANPQNGGPAYISPSHARRYVRRGDAKFDAVGRLVWLYCPAVRARAQRNGPLEICKVTAFSGRDAFPDRAVMPPSPNVLAQMGSPYRGAVKPPLRPVA